MTSVSHPKPAVVQHIPRLRRHDAEATQQAWDWQLAARCRGMPSQVFFAADGERGGRLLEFEHRAKRICRSCPVLLQCRSYAVEAEEPYGIWGATTPKERRALRRAADQARITAGPSAS